MIFKIKEIVLTLVVAMSVTGVARAQTIPLDGAVRMGRLPNGFTYYIRHNEAPKKRVELYLVNNVGSVLEDDDQQGLAHFMEHMNFNGTKNFPKNELVDYLQKAGVCFGSDLNAYTGFDETVYQLPIPTDDPAMFGNGLKIMRDWAQEATLDPAEIEKERGVILEEERLGKGAVNRMQHQYFPMLLNYARYAQRVPIGKDVVLTGFRPETIKRFFQDWYRPDLQALIIVGDIDVNKTEKLVKAKFSDLKNPEHERERTRYSVPLTGKSQFMAVTDKEETETTLQIILKHPAVELKTEQDYLLSIRKNLLNQLINNRRYAELSPDPNPAYTGVSISVGGLLSNVDMLNFSVSAKEGRLEQSFLQGWRVLERIKRFGFTEGELDRAKQNQLRDLQTSVNEKDKTPSVNYVKEYQRNFLQGEASPGIAWEYRFTQEGLRQIKLSDINDLLNEYLQSKDCDVLVSAPEKDRAGLPDSAAVQSWMTRAAQEVQQPYHDDQASRPLLAVKPIGGSVINKQSIPQLNITRLTLSNGLKVILKPTDFKNDQILYGAFSPGGTSLYDHADYDVAVSAAGLISLMGLGDNNPVELNKALTGKVISAQTTIGMRSQNAMVSTSPVDLETALQVTYLQFTSPRKDPLLFKNSMDAMIAGMANRGDNPNTVFTDTINAVLGNHNYRMLPPTAARVRSITLDRVYDIYRERFGDASGFTFVFVGNFKPEQIIPLLAHYLGALPSAHKNVQARDLGIHIPKGVISKKVYKGTENKATVRIVLSGDYRFSPLANLELKALGDILQIKVLQQLREAESEVYSPQVQVTYNKYPMNRYALNIGFGCAPKNADHLICLVRQELATLKSQGPDAGDIQKFKAQYRKNVELALKDNGFWLNYLLSQHENNESLLLVSDISKKLGRINPAVLKQAAQQFLNDQNMISFELLPETEQPLINK